MAGDERLRELEERYEGYAVYDRASDEVGKVDDILVNGNGREEYTGRKLGSLTTVYPDPRGGGARDKDLYNERSREQPGPEEFRR